jgi:hypothetical protein
MRVKLACRCEGARPVVAEILDVPGVGPVIYGTWLHFDNDGSGRPTVTPMMDWPIVLADQEEPTLELWCFGCDSPIHAAIKELAGKFSDYRTGSGRRTITVGTSAVR